MAFESKKLNVIERRHSIHDKEMWVMIHYFKTWGHYIGSKNKVAWINNVALKYFSIQPKLSSKQMRCQDRLALFNEDIQDKPRKYNVVPNMLRQKHQLKVVYMLTNRRSTQVQT
jgi:hypothetical protein